jgi:hypothetical protein
MRGHEHDVNIRLSCLADGAGVVSRTLAMRVLSPTFLLRARLSSRRERDLLYSPCSKAKAANLSSDVAMPHGLSNPLKCARASSSCARERSRLPVQNVISPSDRRESAVPCVSPNLRERARLSSHNARECSWSPCTPMSTPAPLSAFARMAAATPSLAARACESSLRPSVQ